MASNPNEARKRSTTFESNIHDKKVKLDSGKVEIPNEIWTKIMNYLSKKDIFANFGLVNKRFHGLISGMKYLQVKNIASVKLCKKVIEIVKNSKAITELDLDICYTNASPCSFQIEYYSNFVNQAINLCHRLKSLKISGSCFINLDFMCILKRFEDHLEHLTFDSIQTTPDVLIEINKLKSLRSLKLSTLNFHQVLFTNLVDTEIVKDVDIFNEQVVHALAKNSMKLESIDIHYVSFDPKVSQALNDFLIEKKDTLRKVKLHNFLRKNCKGPELPCESYENLNLCKNLEELSGKLHIHDFQHTQLKKLQLRGVVNSNGLSKFGQINQNNLEHLEIAIGEKNFGQFAKLQSPALKYLMINLVIPMNWNELSSLNIENSKILIRNSPNLKAIKFKGPCISKFKRNLVKIFQEYGPVSINAICDDQLKFSKDYKKILKSRINSTNAIEISCLVENTIRV